MSYWVRICLFSCIQAENTLLAWAKLPAVKSSHIICVKCSLHHCTYENIFLYGWLRLSKNSWAYSLKLTDYIFPIWWLVSSQRNGASQTFIILAHTYSQAGRGGRENDVWSTRHAWPFPLLSGQKSITNSPPLNSFRWVVLKYSCLPIRGHFSLLRSCRPFFDNCATFILCEIQTFWKFWDIWELFKPLTLRQNSITDSPPHNS